MEGQGVSNAPPPHLPHDVTHTSDTPVHNDVMEPEEENQSPEDQVLKGEEDTETESEPSESPQPTLPPVPKPKRGGRSIITLKMLLEEGVLNPGVGVLSVEYKGSTQVADLTEDGRIVCDIDGHSLSFDAPSAFSVYHKRLITPGRKADDGWKSVKYQGGKYLEHYKSIFSSKYLSQGDGASDIAELQERTAKKPRIIASNASTSSQSYFRLPEQHMPASLKWTEPVREDVFPVRPRTASHASLGADIEAEIQPLESYEDPSMQPFAVNVHNGAMITMDFHSHLSTNEVIGLLAGRWDKESKSMTVLKALPVKESESPSGNSKVEMDVDDEGKVRQSAADEGLEIVGWYHSHPCFPALPSKIDIHYQVMQQNRVMKEQGGESAPDGEAFIEPYIAAIVSPFGKHLKSAASCFSWFHVEHRPGVLPAEGQVPREVGCVPRSLAVVQVYDADRQEAVLAAPKKELQTLAKKYAPRSDAQKFDAAWRHGLNRREKLADSLKSWLSKDMDEKRVAAFGTDVLVTIMAVWSVFGGLKG